MKSIEENYKIAKDYCVDIIKSYRKFPKGKQIEIVAKTLVVALLAGLITCPLGALAAISGFILSGSISFTYFVKNPEFLNFYEPHRKVVPIGYSSPYDDSEYTSDLSETDQEDNSFNFSSDDSILSSDEEYSDSSSDEDYAPLSAPLPKRKKTKVDYTVNVNEFSNSVKYYFNQGWDWVTDCASDAINGRPPTQGEIAKRKVRGKFNEGRRFFGL
jgi:hypothetical protein